MSNSEPVALPIKGVEPIYGFTRSETYRRLVAGDSLTPTAALDRASI